MTSQALHRGFNAAVSKILGAQRTNNALDSIEFETTRINDGRTLVHAITDNSDPKQVVRVSHEVTAPDYQGAFKVAVKGPSTSNGSDGFRPVEGIEAVNTANTLFTRVQNAPVRQIA